MSLLDILLTGATLIVAGWWIFSPRRQRSWLRLAPVALLALAVLQFAVEGFYWQLLPAYVLILAAALLSVFSRGAPEARLPRLAGRIGIVALILTALAPWLLFLPAPNLTKPRGLYAVGTEIFRWIDASREETATTDPADKRNVIAQAWYPAARDSRGAHSTYIDGLRDLPDRVTLFPSFLLKSFGRIDTHGVIAAPVSGDRPQWPVIVFSPGYGAPRAFYTSLATGLASRGYVVLALDHPYESAVTEIADGRIVGDQLSLSSDRAAGNAFMASQLDVRAADVRFALDQFERADALGDLSGHLDAAHVAVIGHSFGGATAAVAMDRDPRVKAAANIDGTLYGPIVEKRLSRPFLLLDSDHLETGHSEENIARNQRLLANLEAPGWAYEIKHSNHFSFTDAPLFFAPPGSFVLSLLVGGGRGPTETHRATIDILDAFLSGPLGRESASVEAAVAKYKEIAGGPVQ